MDVDKSIDVAETKAIGAEWKRTSVGGLMFGARHVPAGFVSHPIGDRKEPLVVVTRPRDHREESDSFVWGGG